VRGLLQNAKSLRSQQTDAEQKLWYHLRAHRYMGLKFKRQKPIGRYIVDFVCPERSLIIELDGGQHTEQMAYDTQRDAWLHGEGYTVLRFWNNEVMQEMEGVLEKIRITLFPSPPPSPRVPQEVPLGCKRGEGAESLPSPQPSPHKRGEEADLLPSPARGRGAGGEGSDAT
jgi:very-short-patch-repair endonuclease